MDKQTWTDDLRRKMADYSMSPPDHLWESIDSRMREEATKGILRGAASGVSEQQSIRMTTTLHRRRMWAAAAAVAGMMLVGGGVWMQMYHDGNGGRPSVPSMASSHTALLSQHSGSRSGAEATAVSGERQLQASASSPLRRVHPTTLSSVNGLIAEAVLPKRTRVLPEVNHQSRYKTNRRIQGRRKNQHIQGCKRAHVRQTIPPDHRPGKKVFLFLQVERKDKWHCRLWPATFLPLPVVRTVMVNL